MEREEGHYEGAPAVVRRQASRWGGVGDEARRRRDAKHRKETSPIHLAHRNEERKDKKRKGDV